MNIIHNVLRLPNSSVNYDAGNLSGPIHTGHNQHTHTANTRQPELNLKVPRVRPPSRDQLEECHVLNPYPELNLKDTF